MGQMAGLGQYLIMVIRRHLQHFRAHGSPDRPHFGGGRRVGDLGGGEDYPVVPVQVRIGGADAALFLAGNGVAGHEAGVVLAQGLARRGDHIAFDAAAVGDDRRAGQTRLQRRQHRAHGRDRGGDKYQIGAFDGLSQILTAFVDHAQGNPLLQGSRRAGTGHDGSRQPVFARGGSKGATDQAQADNGNAAEEGFRHGKRPRFAL